MVVVIKVDTRNVERMFEGYSIHIPKAGNRAAFNLARFGGKVLKEEARIAGIKHWGGGIRQLFSRQTRGKRIRRGVYATVMPIHGFHLSEMRPHFVALKRGRLITKWARDKGFKGSVIRVHPHPFLKPAIARVVAKVRKMSEKEVNKAIKRKGKG